MEDDVVLSLQNVSYQYPTGKKPVLRNIDLTVKAGEYIGLVGTTGAGKTTLCQTFNGLIPHYTQGRFRGQVEVMGLDMQGSNVADLSRSIGLVFEDADAQLIMSTVEEECMFGLLCQGKSRAEVRPRVHEILEVLEIPFLASRAPQTLSGGQKQRVAIAAVMVTQPAILVLDEATSQLDAMMTQKIFTLCDKLNQQFNTTIIIVSHEMELLAQHASRMILMDQGTFLLDGQVNEVLQQAETFQRVGVRLPQVVELATRLDTEISWPRLPINEDEMLAILRQLA